MQVSVEDMMEAREQRAARQKALLAAHGKTLLCFTMNIPGPVKDSPLIREGFRLGLTRLHEELLRRGIRPVQAEVCQAFTGPEAYLVLPVRALTAKRMAAGIEEESEVGRLFDMDVLDPDGRKADRAEIGFLPRTCLLCGKPAAVCARSRAHSLAELTGRTKEILNRAVRRARIQTVSALAQKALLYEVCTTPKPGLVDRANNGSHTDMDIFSFAASVPALGAYYGECCAIGFDTRDESAGACFAKLREAGKRAEGRMLAATNGVNTHRGAIFSLGLICAAAGRLSLDTWNDADALLDECAKLTQGLTETDFAGDTAEEEETAGRKLFREYGIRGVRGEAEDGFPTVRKYGIPCLEEGLSAGLSPDEAGARTLLCLMAEAADTNILRRGGAATAAAASEKAGAILREHPFPDRETIEAFDRELIEKNLSPGGSADLLALCWFLVFLKTSDTLPFTD